MESLKVCKIPYCGREVLRHGFCKNHSGLYTRPNKLKRFMALGFGGGNQGKENFRGVTTLRWLRFKEHRTVTSII